MPLKILKWLHVSWLWVYRVATWGVIVGGLLFLTIALAARYWLLPHIGDYRQQLEQSLSQAAQQRITIGTLEGRWQGWHLILAVGDVTVYTRAGQPGLHLDSIENTVSWWSLVYLEPRLRQIEIAHPVLDIRREADGQFMIAGIHIRSNGEGNGGFANWLLHQDRIVVRDAQITWQDDVRGAPPLTLRAVDFRLDNSGWWQRHRFGLRATPPAVLASPLDVRGDLQGGNFADPKQWSGKLYARLDYVDIEAWRTWLPFSGAFPRGVGGARLWVSLDEGEVVGVTADAQLAHVLAQLKPSLPALSLKTLSGRMTWQRLPEGFHVETTQLALTTDATTDAAASAATDATTSAETPAADNVANAAPNIVLAPVDFSLDWQRGETPASERGKLRANRLDIVPLVALADYLPLDEVTRAKLASYAPRGNVSEVVLEWQGAWPQPKRYQVRARFSDLGLTSVDGLPGFAGISGEVSGDEDGGTLKLGIRYASVDAPRVFATPIALDNLAAKITWEHDDGWRVRFNDLTFSNRDLAGGLTGSYRLTADGKRIADLTGRLTRADPTHIATYLPVFLNAHARAWLEQAFPAGSVRDARLRLKGDLARFPFAGNQANARDDSVFRIAAKLTGVTLHYSPKWPQIENMSGDLVFSGRRMDVIADRGTLPGVALKQARASIPDLFAQHHTLSVSADAEGDTSKVIDVLEQSPVAHIVEGVADTRVQGRGQLALNLMIPFADVNATQVKGSYRFLQNRMVEVTGPAFEQVDGVMDFDNKSIKIDGITFRFLGGPALLKAVHLEEGGTQLVAQGRADLDQYLRENPNPSWRWLKRLSGATDWTAQMTLRGGQSDFAFQSGLTGLTSALPAPFAKSAQEALPIVYARHILNPEQRRMEFTLGKLVDASWLQQRIDEDTNDHNAGKSWEITRGSIRLGDGALPRDRGGVTVGGHLARFDLDDLLSIGHSRNDKDRIALRNLNAVDLRIDELDVFGRAFHDLTLGTPSVRPSDVLQVTLNGRELVGDLAWDPAGVGRVQARLRQLTVPEVSAPVASNEAGVSDAAAATAVAKTPASVSSTATFPIVDVVADNVVFKNKQLGRLELTAQPSAADVRIDRFNIWNPDVALQAHGTWYNWRKRSARTEAALTLDAPSIEKLFARLGLTQTIKRGAAHLEANLSWDGAPQSFDYRVISGALRLKAEKGQFSKIDPGAGKLLGILSLQSLPQRFSFDFRDVFSKGLAFEEITGDIDIKRGIAHSDNLRIEGPAARIHMNGYVDLAQETQQLHVKVYPQLSTATAIGVGVALGPVAGVGALLAQKVLKNPIEQMTSSEYNITGTWSAPEMAKVARGETPAVQSGRPD